MQAFFASIRKGISNQRLNAYPLRGVNSQEIDVLAHYLWNVALNESLYPVLQTFEVTLRNSIHEAASNVFGTDKWYEAGQGILGRGELQKVVDAENKLINERKVPDPGRVVAALSFGFWTKGIVKPRYDRSFWHRIIRHVFPHMPRASRNRATIVVDLDKIWYLRNRVFHHEPVWYLPNLMPLYSESVKYIGFINQEMEHFVSLSDRFQEIYTQGATPYQVLIHDKIRDLGLS